MNRAGEMVRNLAGDLAYKSYRPAPLPPVPGIEMNAHMTRELGQASRNLAELDTLVRHIPDVQLFLCMYLRKEALLSSQIEGTQCTLEDVLAADVEENVSLDVAEVASYVRAVEYAVSRRRELPLCNRLLREVHRELLNNARGADKEPGEFRRSQNWIGPAGCSLRDARYVPPNVEDMGNAMSELERYINEDDGTDPLIKAALVHYQFETIHPFLDGNGRLGRLLILLCLMEWDVLHSPVLYVSYFLKKNQWEYYGKLSNVRENGNYEQWILFFLEAINKSASDAVSTIFLLKDIYNKNIVSIKNCVKCKQKTLDLFTYINFHPIVTVKSVKEALGISTGTARICVDNLVSMKILNETTHKTRNRIFAYTEYLNILARNN